VACRRIVEDRYFGNGFGHSNHLRIRSRLAMRMVLCSLCKAREAHFYEHGVPVCRDCLDMTLWHEADLYRIVGGTLGRPPQPK